MKKGDLMIKNKLSRFFKLSIVPLIVLFLSSCQHVALLDPQGPIGSQEKFLILISLGLMLIVVIPVFVMVIWFSIRYRESNAKATYKPEWEGSMKIEAVLWLIPLAIIIVLSYLTWTSTHDLDPYKPIASKEAPIRVQVVSLDWNWLFIYPDYGIASVNKLVFPAATPVSFELTSATVMTSFFIPDLGSQIYAMGGMRTRLNLLADKPGNFIGHNMQYSGIGYGSMDFPAISLSADQFAAWAKSAKENKVGLSLAQFNTLNTPQS